ncbi:MAG: MopE-related protein [Polyangiales bacterium]
MSGAAQDSCAPGAATGADTLCDGVDEDCDGSTDEGYVSAATSCGAGVCGATGATSCVSGAVQDSCAPGAATGTDSVCDGLDEDCDGSTDEAYASTTTSCGVGVCGATGATSCVGGAVQDSCAPGTATGADTVCDGVDEDCDGSTDEGYASTATTCGVGVCGATGATSCVSGAVQDSCAPGAATGADAACDGLDDDCDGSTDEGYVSTATSCGAGVCGATGATSCVSGAVQDSCAPGAATGADTLCDGLDEDCDGSTDEAYVSTPTTCGVGVCGASGAIVCTAGAVQDTCAPGAATGADDTCDGLDDDCDGTVDEAYVVVCAGSAVRSCVDGAPFFLECSDGDACNGVESCAAGACAAGAPVVVDDGNPCTDDVCDTATGEVTHGAAPDGTACLDDDVCDGSEMCMGGACWDVIPAGDPLPCGDGPPVAAFVVPELQDVAAQPNGATVASVTGSTATWQNYNNGAVDRREDRMGWNWNGGSQITLDLAGDTPHVVEHIAFWASRGTLQIRDFEVWSSMTGGDDFERVHTGRFEGTTWPGTREDVFIPPTPMRFLRIVSLNGGGLGWLQARTRTHNGGVVSTPEGGATVTVSNGTGTFAQILRYTPLSSWDLGASTGHMTVDLMGDLPVLVDRVHIAGSTNGPRNYEILTSATGSADADFVVAHVGVLPPDSTRRLVRFPAVPARFVRVRVLDTHGASSRQLTAFYVIAANQGPTTARFDDASIAGDAPILHWQWRFGDGATSNERFPTHTFEATGTYSVSLTVLDAYGRTHTATQPYHAFALPQPRYEPATPFMVGLQSRLLPRTIHETPLIGWWWDVVPGTASVAGPPSQPDVRPTDAGPLEIQETVLDARFSQASDVTYPVVANRDPDLGDGETVTLPWGQSHLFRVYMTDRESADCHWDFGDGNVLDVPRCSTGTSAWLQQSHAWPDPGAYVVTLDVTDALGGTDRATWNVLVDKHDMGISTEPVTDIVGGGLHDVRISLGDATLGNVVGARALHVSIDGGGSVDVTSDTDGRATASVDFGDGDPTLLRVRFDGDSHYNPARTSVEAPEAVVPDRPDNCGREFWVAFGPNEMANATQRKHLFFYAERQTTVRISGAESASLVVTPGEGATHELRAESELRDSGTIENTAIHIESDRVVCVHGMNAAHATTDGFLALPVDMLGTSYVVSAWGGSILGAESETMIIATEDGTVIDIVASMTTVSTYAGSVVPRLTPGSTRQFTMNRGEAVRIRGQSGADLTGTRISSNKPVAVFGGHDCAYVDRTMRACDLLTEMQLPMELWGTSYLVSPFRLRTAGYLLRVMGGQDATEVRLNGALVGTVDATEVLELTVNAASLTDEHVVVTTSAPASVTQFMLGSSAESGSLGDPAQMSIVPTEQFLNSYLISADVDGGLTPFAHFVRIIVEDGHIGGLRLDGAPIVETFTPIGSSGYSAAEVEVSSGVHRVSHVSTTVPFGVYAYGLDTYDSYAYPAGYRTVPLAGGCAPTPTVAGDGLDNDCDGRADEELANGVDDDGDGLVDEDLALGEGPPTNVAPIALDRQVLVREDAAESITLAGFDANGDALSYAVLAQPAHGVVTGAGQSWVYTPSTDYVGADAFTFMVNDGQLDSEPGTVAITVYGENDVPDVRMSQVVSVLEDAVMRLPCIAVDVDLDGDLTWELLSGPVGMTMDPDTSVISWLPGDIESAVVTVRVTDSRGGSSDFTFVVNVQDIPEDPYIVSRPVSEVAFDAAYRYTVVARDPDAGAVLTYHLVSGPVGMTIDAATGVLSWSPTIADAGEHPVEVVAQDETGLSSQPQRFVVRVLPDTSAPQVTVTATPSLLQPGQMTILHVAATDNHGSIIQSLEVDGTPVAVDSNGNGSYVGTTPGVRVATATVVDPSGNVGTGSTLVRVLDAGDTSAPTVALTSPADGAELSYLHDVVGTVRDDNLYTWRVTMRFIGESYEQVMLTGSNEVSDETLGELDTTQLVNGLYILRLYAEDVNGQWADATQTVRVTGDAKLGTVRFSVTDVAMPTHDVPVTLTRHYDSTDPRQGDFGYGWRLEESQSSVQVSRPLGEGIVIWTREGSFALPCTDVFEQKQHSVEVRLSDDEYYTFGVEVSNLTAISGRCSGEVFLEQVAGTVGGAELVPRGNTAVFSINYGRVSSPLRLPPNSLTDVFTGEVWNETEFELRLPDGRKYRVDTLRGTTALIGRNGRSVVYNRDNMIHSGGRYVTYQRDTQGRIVQVRDQDGRTVEYSYSAAGDLVAVADQLGRVTTYEYDPNHAHHLVAITDPRGVRVLAAAYQDDGRISESCDADSVCHGYEYDLPSRRGVTRNTDGAEVALSYDIHGRINARTDALGNTWTYVHSHGQLVQETDPTGARRTYEYDGLGRRVASTAWHGPTDDPADFRTSWTFDGGSTRIDVLTLRRGGIVDLDYDARGNQTAMSDGDGNVVWSATYDSLGRRTSQTDRSGTETYEYASSDQSEPTRVVSADGVVEDLVYDATGNLSEVRIDGERWTMGYDALNRQTSQTFPDGGQQAFEYTGSLDAWTVARDGDYETRRLTTVGGRLSGWVNDGRTDVLVEYNHVGLPVAVRSADGTAGVVTEYDAGGRVISQRDISSGASTSFVRDGAGRALETTDAAGHVYRNTYDAGGRLSTTTDPLGHVWQYGQERLASLVTDPLGRTTRTETNEYGQMTRMVFADGTTSTVSYLGASSLEEAGELPVLVVDEVGRQREFGYADLELSSATDTAGSRWTYATSELMTTIVSPEGRVRTIESDDVGRVIRLEYADGAWYENAYTEANLTSRTDITGTTVTLSHDAEGRETERTTNTGEVRAIGYDASGDIASVVTADTEVSYSRDAEGRVTQVVSDAGAVTYAYDVFGHVQSMTVAPIGGATTETTREYDAAGNVVAIVDSVLGRTEYAYDEANQRVGRTLPNGVETSYTYDLRGRIASITHRAPGGAVLMARVYTRSASGEPTRVTREDGSYVQYGYDAALRLTSEQRFDSTGAQLGETTYTYDRDGNRLSVGRDGVLDVYGYGAGERLVSVTRDGAPHAAYDHDALGRTNMLTVGGANVGVTYDSLDRAVTISGPRPGMYRYDGEGRRVRLSSATGDAVQHLVVDSPDADVDTPLVALMDGAVVARYVHGIEGPLARIDEGGMPRFYLEDGLGSIIGHADQDGDVLGEIDYDAFGDVLSGDVSDELGGDFGFQGMWRDPTGLYYVHARMYDPAVGRFLTRDLAEGDPQDVESWIAYAFAANNPSMFTDPTGLFTISGQMAAANVRQVLSQVARNGLAQRVRYQIKQEIQEAVGELILDALVGLLMSQIPGMSGAASTLSPMDAGNVLESVIESALCQNMPNAASQYMFLEVPIGNNGAPGGPGFRCGVRPPNGGSRRRGVNFRSHSFPDFLISTYVPTDLERSKTSMRKSFVAGDVKLRPSTIRTSRKQFRRLVAHGARYSYGPVVAYLSLFKFTPRDVQRITRRANAVGRSYGRPVYPALVGFR